MASNARQAERKGRRSPDELMLSPCGELCRQAERLRDERSGQPLQPTALVHEAYLRLAGQRIQVGQSGATRVGNALEARVRGTVPVRMPATVRDID